MFDAEELMGDEWAFLQAVLEAPADDVSRLVYADWLQERGDPRADFLRLECEVTGRLPAAPPTRLRRRFETLCRTTEPDWVALVRRQPVPDAVEAALTELESMLGGLNYVVSLAVHRVPVAPDAPPEKYIGAALGPGAVVAGIHPVNGEELLAQVEECLRYPGTTGHGPDAPVLRSSEFEGRLGEVLSYLRRSVGESNLVSAFTLRSGHPFYPVMWDFAYVLVKAHCAVVFMGASSD
jgi:uncharacterized protein (TIGR02996 family)